MSFELLSSAYSASYIIAVVIFTKDLIKQLINLSFYLGKALSLSVFTSSTLIILSEFRPFFARLSALSFQKFSLCPLTLVRLSSNSLALQQSLICLIKLQFLILNNSRKLLLACHFGDLQLLLCCLRI